MNHRSILFANAAWDPSTSKEVQLKNGGYAAGGRAGSER
jgi:hypothetical protein